MPPGNPGQTQRPFRLCVDVNVWFADLRARSLGREGTAAGRVIDLVRSMQLGDRPLQLIVPRELIGTLERVLLREGIPENATNALVESIFALSRYGPEQIDPFLFSGRDHLQMHDREDAGVLAAAIAARADMLVTDNLKDFETNDSERVPTRTIHRNNGDRQLYAVLHERADGVALVVAHPIDLLDWLRLRLDLSPEGIRRHYIGTSR